MLDYIKNPRGHQWQLNEDGTVDIFGCEPAIYCNGPLCVKCGLGFCHHCDDGPDEDCRGEDTG